MKGIICISLWLILTHFKPKNFTVCTRLLPLSTYASHPDEYKDAGSEDSSKKTNHGAEVTQCPVMEPALDCNSTSSVLNKINLELIDINYLNCDILEFKESQFNESTLGTPDPDTEKFRTNSSNNTSIKNCPIIYTRLVESTVTSPKNWKIINIDPAEAQIDTEIQPQLLIQGEELKSNNVKCFVNSPDNNTDILSVTSLSGNQIKCESFIPVVPGFHKIGIIIFERFYLIIGNNSFKIFAKSPVAREAEYSPDFQSIAIYFDQNIELFPDCLNSFSKETQQNFGSFFTCSVKGNVLQVKMGFDYKPMSSLEIVPENKIYRAGTRDFRFSPPALSVIIPVSERRVLSPNLSIYLENFECDTSEGQKHLSIKVIPSENQKLHNTHKMISPNAQRRNQRENLIIWRTIRGIQRELNFGVVFKPFEGLSNFEDIASVGNFLKSEQRITRSPVTPTAVVSVVVVSTPTPSTILAEANVTFCNDTVSLYRYKWTVNDEVVSEDGKLLLVDDLPPGKYTIKCFIVENNSSEIMGQGWVTTQIVSRVEEVIIFPTEITVGTMDDVVLQAMTQHRKSVSWICKTFINKPCSVNLPKDVDLNSPLLSIPAGTLSVGSFIWTVEGAQEWNIARVFVKPGLIPGVNVELSSVFITSFQNVTLKGVIKRLQSQCRVLWSSVRHKGFDYFNLDDVSIYEETGMPTEDGLNKNVSLIIPGSVDNVNGLKPNSLYLFKLQAICPHSDSFSRIEIPIRVSEPPRVSPVRVQPQTGNSLITHFEISGAEANDSLEDQPLLFEWSYSEPCDTIVPIRRGAYSTPFTVFLPPGDLKVIVKVCNVRKSCTIVSSQNITVYQVADVPPNNFEIVRSRIKYLMTAGETLEAFGLAITAFKALALIAETQIRESLYSTLEEVIENRMNDLTKRLKKGLKIEELSLEFFQQAVPCLKYFRKGSSIVQKLNDFENNILKDLKTRSDSK